MPLITVRDISYVYQSKYQKVKALKSVSADFEKGQFYAITGESGSGKSTLLSLLTGLDFPTTGEILINDRSIRDMNLDEYRRKEAAVVYQSFYLMPLLTALENVMFPLELNKVPKAEACKAAQEYLLQVGIKEERHRHFPKMMSGGEQQRVAIARAMAGGGDIILADEPTGNLDSENEEMIVDLLIELKKSGYLIIVVTHNSNVASRADHEYRMKDGVLDEV